MSITSFQKQRGQMDNQKVMMQRHGLTATNTTELSIPTSSSSISAVPLSSSLKMTYSTCGTSQTITVGRYKINLPISQKQTSFLYAPAKRAMDIATSGTLLLVLFPLFLFVAFLIFLEDRGPILYYQTRIGKDGQPFLFYKFRSMVTNADQIRTQLESQNEAEGPIFKMKNDPRITRIGRIIRRYSIDELPQLFNVLRGDMSLVGPRPHLPREVALYTGRQPERLKVQPGLLCFREVLGRSNMTFEEWVDLDLLYIEHRCVRTDLMILLRTIPSILAAEGAY